MLGDEIRKGFICKSLSKQERPCSNSPLRERATTSKPRLRKENRPMVFLPSLQREAKRGEVKGAVIPFGSPPPRKRDPTTNLGPS